jgi:ABC-2 type transport system permease protein
MTREPSASPVCGPKRPAPVKNLLVGLCAFRLQLRRLREYALSFWSSLASIPVLMVVTYFAWRVVFGGRTTVNGYTFAGILSYYFLMRVVSPVIWQAGAVAWNVWQDINSGNLASYLARPLDYNLLSLGKCAGPAFCNLVAGTITYAGAAFVLRLPVALTPTRVAFFAASVFGGFLVVYLTQFIVAVLAFWIGRTDTLRDLLYEMYAFFSGSIIPNDFLPPLLQQVAGFLPLRFLFYVPVSGLLGRLPTDELPGLLLTEFAWIVGLALVLRILWRRGVTRFEAQGG